MCDGGILSSWSGAAGTKRVSQPFGCVAGDAGTERVFVVSVRLNVGTFNLGLDQNQIEAKGFPKGNLANFRRIIAKDVQRPVES